MTRKATTPLIQSAIVKNSNILNLRLELINDPPKSPITPTINPLPVTLLIQSTCKGRKLSRFLRISFCCLDLDPTYDTRTGDQSSTTADLGGAVHNMQDLTSSSWAQGWGLVEGKNALKDIGSTVNLHVLDSRC